MSRFSYSSGADEMMTGYKLGTSIADRNKKAQMDKETGDILAREQAEKADYVKGMGLTGADQQAMMLQEQDAGGGREAAGLTAAALNSNTQDTTKADAAASTRYALGANTQDTAYTPEQVRGLNRADARAALGKYGEEGAARIAQLDTEEARAEGLTAAKRANKKAAGEDLMDENVGKQLDRLAITPPDSPEYAALQKSMVAEVVKGKGAVAGQAFAENMEEAAAKRRERGAKEESTAIFKASNSEKDALKYFNDKFKDDAQYIAHKNPDGTTSIVQEGKDGVGTVVTYKNWSEARDQLITKIPEISKMSWELDVKHKQAIELQELKNKAAKSFGAAAAKYGSAKDAYGNMYAKGKDGVYRDIDGNPFDAKVGGELFILGTQAQAKPVDSVKLAEAVAKYDEANPEPKMKYTSAMGFGNTDAQDKDIYEKAMAAYNAKRETFITKASGETTGGLDTGEPVAKPSGPGAPAEVRYRGNEAYIRGKDGSPTRAPQYDKK